jgi:adenylate cyclase
MSASSKTTKSLVILPFRFHQESEISDAGLSEGLADSLAARLIEVEGLSIRPTSSVKRHLSKESDSFALGKSLEVNYILEGSIFSAGDRTRFTVQLLNIPERGVSWGAQFDETETDAFRLEDKVSERIFRAVLPYLETADYEPVTDSMPAQQTDEIIEEPLQPEKERSLILPTKKASQKSRSLFALISLLIAGVFLGGFLLWRGTGSEDRLPFNGAEPTILVLPFQSDGGAAIDSSLGTGLSEALTGNLGNVKNLFVLSANAGRDASRANLTPSQIGRAFNVNYLLRGSIRHPGEQGKIRADVELIESASENILWNRIFEVKRDDLNNLQAQISEAILNALAIKISEADKRKIAKRSTNNGIAYEFYLIGRYQMTSRSADGLNRAIGAFSQALEKDSTFALAYVGLADAYALRTLYENPPPPDTYERAEKNASLALKLDENLAEAHTTMGYLLFYSDRDRAGSERAFRRAVELNPSYATTHHWFGMTLSASGKHREGIAEIELAQKLDPRSAIITTAKGMLHLYARQYREGLNECEKALAIDSAFVPAHKAMRWIFQATDNYSGALDSFQKEKSFGGYIDAPGWLVIESQVESVGKNFEKARALLEKALASAEVSENPKAYAYEIALAYIGLNNREKILEWLEKAEAVGNHSFNFIEVDPRLDKVRDEERFKALIKKLQKIN